MDMKKIMHDTLILFVICIISGLCLGIAYEITWPITAARKAEEKAATYREIFVDGADFKDGEVAEHLENQAQIIADAGLANGAVTDCMTVYDASGALVGYAISATANGKEGTMTTAVCYGVDGVVRGIKVLDHKETAGLGDKCENPEFTDMFKDKAVDSFSVVKGGTGADGEIECLAGATLTSNGVVNAVNAAIAFAQYCMSN